MIQLYGRKKHLAVKYFKYRGFNITNPKDNVLVIKRLDTCYKVYILETNIEWDISLPRGPSDLWECDMLMICDKALSRGYLIRVEDLTANDLDFNLNEISERILINVILLHSNK